MEPDERTAKTLLEIERRWYAEEAKVRKEIEREQMLAWQQNFGTGRFGLSPVAWHLTRSYLMVAVGVLAVLFLGRVTGLI